MVLLVPPLLMLKMAQSDWTDCTKLQLQGVKRTEKKEALGKGSYGCVIEVSVDGTICAAKVIHEILVEEVGKKDFEATEKMFLNECANSSRILHPNVVQFLGIYYPPPKDKLPWLIMEMMYTNLTSLIEKYKTTDLPLHIKLSILVNTSQGLQYLHSRDIIHRDLSSNNVLLTKHMVAKIADFGMAKMIMPDFRKYTQAPGTLPFMPLEALSVQPRYGKPLDVFSLGCVSVHIISMQWPIPADQTRKDIKTGKRVVLSEVERRNQYLARMIDKSSLKRLTMSCLQDEPEDRPTIENITKELQSIKAVTKLEVEHTDNIVDLLIHLSQVEQLVTNKNEEMELKSHRMEEMMNSIREYNAQLQSQCSALHAQLEKERKNARTKAEVYKKKTEQFQVQWKKREEVEQRLLAVSKELDALKKLNIDQQTTILNMQRKNKFEIEKVRKELEAQCQTEREEANECLQAVAKQLHAQQELTKQQLAAQKDLNKQQLATIDKFLQRDRTPLVEVSSEVDINVPKFNDDQIISTSPKNSIPEIISTYQLKVADQEDKSHIKRKQSEWSCHYCGAENNRGRFCRECGERWKQ